MIVVVVIAILAAITIVAFNGIQNRAKTSALQTSTSQASKKLLAHAITTNDAFPNDLATIGISNSDATSYKYVYDNAPDPNIYCVSAQKDLLSYAATNTTGSLIEGRCVNNRTLNPSIESNATYWGAAGTGGTVLNRVTSEKYAGDASLQVITNGAASNQGAFTVGRASVQPDTTYTASIWIKGTVGRTLCIELGELNSSGTVIGTRTASSIVTADGTWQRLTATRTMGSTVATADIVVRNVTAPAHTFYVDAAMISEGD